MNVKLNQEQYLEYIRSPAEAAKYTTLSKIKSSASPQMLVREMSRDPSHNVVHARKRAQSGARGRRTALLDKVTAIHTVTSTLNKRLSSTMSHCAGQTSQITSLLNEVNFFKAEKELYQSAKHSHLQVKAKEHSEYFTGAGSKSAAR